MDGTDEQLAAAVAAATGADVAVVVVGERSGLTDDCQSGEARDRLELGLPGRQAELVAAVVATGTPVVLVLVSGRPLAIASEAASCAAILHAWVPGDEGAGAIADVLFGDFSPGGKLPVTVPWSVGQVPIYYAHKPSGGRSNWKGDYVDGPHQPLWPFGFGLSYTTFSIGELSVDRDIIEPGGEVAADASKSSTPDRGPVTRWSSSTPRHGRIGDAPCHAAVRILPACPSGPASGGASPSVSPRTSWHSPGWTGAWCWNPVASS